jgi:hypothetical protein
VSSTSQPRITRITRSLGSLNNDSKADYEPLESPIVLPSGLEKVPSDGTGGTSMTASRGSSGSIRLLDSPTEVLPRSYWNACKCLVKAFSSSAPRDETHDYRILPDNLGTSIKILLSMVANTVRRRVVDIFTKKIEGDRGTVIAEVTSPLFTIVSSTASALTATLLGLYRNETIDEEHERKFLNYYHFAMLANLLINIPIAIGPAFFVPEIIEGLGKEKVNDIAMECRLMVLPIACTALQSVSKAMTDPLLAKRKTYDVYYRIFAQELPTIGLSLGAYFTNSYRFLVLGQTLTSAVGMGLTYWNIRKGIEEMGCPLAAKDRLALSLKEKWDCFKTLATGIPGGVGDAITRFIFMLMLAHKQDDAAISFYYLYYQIYFTIDAIVRCFAKPVSYAGKKLSDAENRRKNEKWTMAVTFSLSLIFTLLILAIKDPLINFLNTPDSDDNIKANEWMNQYFPLLAFCVITIGPMRTQLEKMSNLTENRILAGILDVLPQALVLVAMPFISPFWSVLGLLTSWAGGNVLDIIVGLMIPPDPPTPIERTAPSYFARAALCMKRCLGFAPHQDQHSEERIRLLEEGRPVGNPRQSKTSLVELKAVTDEYGTAGQPKTPILGEPTEYV